MGLKTCGHGAQQAAPLHGERSRDERGENANTKKSSAAMIFAAWVLAGVLLAWGRVVRN